MHKANFSYFVFQWKYQKSLYNITMLPTSLNIWALESDHRACIVSVFRLQLNDCSSCQLYLCDPCVNLCVCFLGWIKVGAKFEKVFIPDHTWKQDVSQILPIFKIWEISPGALLKSTCKQGASFTVHVVTVLDNSRKVLLKTNVLYKCKTSSEFIRTFRDNNRPYVNHLNVQNPPGWPNPGLAWKSHLPVIQLWTLALVFHHLKCVHCYFSRARNSALWLKQALDPLQFG